MTRLMVLWEHPAMARPEEVEAMTRWEVAKLTTERPIKEAVLTRLEPVRGRAAWYGWLLEVELDGADNAYDRAAEARLLEALLGELRQLGLHPIAMVGSASTTSTAAG